MNIYVFWNINFSNLYFMFSEVPTARAKQHNISGYLKEKLTISYSFLQIHSSVTLFYTKTLCKSF